MYLEGLRIYITQLQPVPSMGLGSHSLHHLGNNLLIVPSLTDQGHSPNGQGHIPPKIRVML